MNEVDARKDEPEARRAKSTIDNGAAAVMGDVEPARTDAAMLTAPGPQDPLAMEVAGERVEITSA